jgi:hypothetical protein
LAPRYKLEWELKQTNPDKTNDKDINRYNYNNCISHIPLATNGILLSADTSETDVYKTSQEHTIWQLYMGSSVVKLILATRV